VAGDKKNGYVTRVRDNTRGYIEELLRENAQLRRSSERARVEHDELRRQVEALREDVVRYAAQTERLMDLLGEAEAETRRNEGRFGEVEQQNANLAMLYTASYQLHATVRRAEVLLAIQEIVINLVGSEELAVLGVDGAALQPLVNVGVDPEVLGALRADDGAIGRALASGVTEVADRVEPGGLTACIPLRVADRPIALIAIFRLLPQKQSLSSFDRELFELIAAHASTALYCAELHERRGDA
jgi:hypothetical protein